MAGPYIVFFDTFVHNGQTQENTDCVRFKSGVQLLELRILPFGSVVESNLSDEAIIGATNPAAFDLSLYSNSRTNCVVLQNITSHHFDEKNGINCITLKEPVHSNFLLFRGRYSTLTVAIFGIPALSFNQTLPPGTNLSIPPPQLGLTTPASSAATYQATGTPVFTQAATTALASSSDAQLSWSEDSVADSLSQQKQQTNHQTIDTLISRTESGHTPFAVAESKDEIPEPQPDTGDGLYEDGEIQDIDYEEISSNEEIFSDADEAELAEEERQSLDLFRESDPRLNRCFWRFNPWLMAAKGETGSASERLRIPDPTMTLFQFHCWLLGRTERSELEPVDEKETGDSVEGVQDTAPDPSVNDPTHLPPPPSDLSVCATSAQYLLSLVERFGPTANCSLQENWVEAMESLEQHLAPGLAFLYQTDRQSFQGVTEALIIWIYAGLDLSTALRQQNSAYIVRHLMVGVKLTGLVTGTICSQIAWPLLYPSISAMVKNTESRLDVLQVQHLLLNLLESPLITTPLRLAICRALDQTTRLSVGMDAFLGRECSLPSVDENPVSSEATEPPVDGENKETSSQLPFKMDTEQTVVEDVQMPPNPEDDQPTEPSDAPDQLGDIKSEAESVEPIPVASRTPYQRLLFLFSASRNARVTHAYQHLLNKIHAYELLLDFRELLDKLRLAELESSSPQEWFKLEHKLSSYLNEIARILQNARELLANPRTTLPCPMVLEAGKQVYHDPYPDLCSLLDSTSFLENLAWLAGQFSRVEPEPVEPMDTTVSVDTSTAAHSNAVEPDLFKFTHGIHRSQTIWSCFERLLVTMFSEVNSLLLFASRPEPTTLLLRGLLSTTLNEPHPHDPDGPEEMMMDRLVLGLELAYKLEAIRYVDLLIDCTRKKGVTGLLSTMSQFASATAVDRVQMEPELRNALFGLARLCTSSLGSVTFGLTNPELIEMVKSILSSSAPVWVSDVLTMDDYFSPLLMLVEAFGHSAAGGNTLSKTKSSEQLKQVESSEKAVDVPVSASSDPAPTAGLRATLRQLLSSPLELSSLVNVIILTVLRHSERVSYLDRYGPRLAQQVTADHAWEENLSDSAAVNTLTRLESFSHSAAPLLRWLRDCPTNPSAMNVFTMCDTHPLSADAFVWFVNQLKPVFTELEEALDGLLGLEVADELANAAGSIASPTSAGRKQLPNQGIVAGHCLPPAALLLLRIIRAHVCGPPPRKHSSYPESQPEEQVVLDHSLALIELFSANGLHKLSSLLQKLSEYFLLQCQASLPQASCSLDLLNISTLNSNISLLFGILEAAVHLVSQLLITILRIRGNEFRDLTPIRPLCYAYATTIYAVAPPGPIADQLKRLRKAAVAGLLAYGTGSPPVSLSAKDIEKSPWGLVCREIISFTIAAPLHYLPGLRLLLELLPLPLPIYTVEPLDNVKQKKLRASRDQWSVYLIGLAPELTGLVELLGGTDPVPTNPLYSALLQLITRLADLGYPCATFLATSCLDSLFAVWDELVDEQRRKSSSTVITTGSNAEDSEKPSNPTRPETSTTTTAATPGDTSGSVMTDERSQATVTVRTPSARLMLHSVISSETDINVEMSASIDTMTPAAAEQSSSWTFTDLEDPSELASALSLFYANLQVPACRFALLYLLRQSTAQRETSTRGPKSTDDSPPRSDRIRKRQLLNLADNLLSVCSDKASHVRVQMLLLKCLALLVSPSLALNGFTHGGDEQLILDGHSQVSSELRLVEGLPDAVFSEELITILVKHLITPERDMTTLPAALLPLLLLSQHDSGFLLVRSALDSPVAQLNGQHLFANMVQRVNDCFSAENPDCQATLAGCLSLLQSLLVGRTNLPLTFSPETSAAESNPMPGKLRHAHISGARVRDWLGWSGGGDEGKPVRDLHALLEMLADDEPSLEYLRSGMKNLLALLSEEFDVSACEECDSNAQPQPRPIEELFAGRPYFVSLLVPTESVSEEEHRRIIIARWCINNKLSTNRVLFDRTGASSDALPYLVPYNLSELASSHCNNLSIREELLKCGRQRDSAETAIRHQKRRRGQTSIIETGRSSKKFVAPMRGRGFMFRGGPGASGGSSCATNSASSGSMAGGSRLDPFRSRPLNTSRPPSLHVDDFTKLVKDDASVEEVSRSRTYRDNRSFRGRGSRVNLGRGASTNVSSTGSFHPTLPFAFGVPALNPLSTTALLPGWPNMGRSFSLLPLNLDPRNAPGRRDRPLR